MLAGIFSSLLPHGDLGAHSKMVESSRFCVDTTRVEGGASGAVHEAILTMFARIIEWSIANGFTEIVTVTDLRFERKPTANGWLRPPSSQATVLAVVCTITLGTRQAHAEKRSSDDLAATFTICGERRRVDCVVDGDTFWFQRQKIRIADIDAPEVSPPGCAYEREKGEAAKRRLLAFLNAGPFSLARGERDEDRYGRKLRIVTRGGNAIGISLVDEDLARPWGGARRPMVRLKPSGNAREDRYR